MRIPHSISALAVVLLLPLLGAAPSVGCEVSSARVTGEFGADGGFRVASAVTADGQAMPELAGATLATVSAADKLTLPAADMAGQQIWLIGDVDGDAGTLAVSCWTHDEQTAKLCGAHPGSSSCATASATAQSASSAGCATKGKAQTASGAGCATKGKAQTASGAGCATSGKAQSASSSCSTSKASSAQSASAGCGISAAACGEKAAAAGCGTATKAQAAKATSKAKAVSASSASSASCAATCSTPCGPSASEAGTSASAAKSATTDGYSIVYSVSGMTCNACVDKVRSAVAELKLDGVRSVDVDLENSRAVLDCSGDVNRKSVQKAITAAGFPAELIVKASSETSPESAERS